MLELAPETESRVQEYATSQGVSVDEAINRLLRSTTPNLPVQARRAPRLQVLPPEEVKRRNAPGIAHLQAHLDTAAQATPEEIADADAEWQAFQHHMNENRRATGERLVYREDTQP